MIRLTKVFGGIILFATLNGCQNSDKGCVEQPDISDINIELEFISLENEFLDIKTEEELRNFFQSHPVIARHFLKPGEYPDEATFINTLLMKLKNPHIDSLQQEVNRVFGDGSELKDEFIKAFKHLKYYYPEVAIPKIKTIATGFDQDMYVSDSLIIVGLDYYLGEGAKFQPLNIYQYMLQRYSPEYIVPSAMLIYGISPRFNETNIEDKTILAEMVSYGKAFYFAKHMMPCTPDTVLIWYTTEEIEGVRENDDIVWAHFVENEIIFDKSHEVRRKYIEERPKTYEIGEAAPGRIGTWVGWEIVRAYMSRNEAVSLQELMSKSDAQELFRESKYKPG